MNWRVNASAVNAHLGEVYVHAKGPNPMATWSEVFNIHFQTDGAPGHEPFAASIIRCRYNARFMKEVGLSGEERGGFIEWIRTSLLAPGSAVPVMPSRLAVLSRKQTDAIYDDDARSDDDAIEWVRSSFEIAVMFGAPSLINVNDLGSLLDSEDMDDLLESRMQIDGEVIEDIKSDSLQGLLASFDSVVPSFPGATSAAVPPMPPALIPVLSPAPPSIWPFGRPGCTAPPMPAEAIPAEAIPAEATQAVTAPAEAVPKVMSPDPYGDFDLGKVDTLMAGDLPYDVDATDHNSCPV